MTPSAERPWSQHPVLGCACLVGLGHRHDIAAGRGAAGHLPYARCDLLASPRQRPNGNGQQHVQRLAHGRRVAGKIMAPATPKMQGERLMTRTRCAIAAACGLLLNLLIGGTALAQKPGGVLKMYHFDSPASLSLHEEVTFAALGPAMGRSTTSSCSTSTYRRRASPRSCRTSRPNGRGTRPRQRCGSGCAKASNGTTVSLSPPVT